MSRRGERYCVNGHDTFKTGRYASRRCCACVAGRHGQKISYLPAEPMRNYIRSLEPIMSQLDLARRYAERFDTSFDSGEAAIRRVLSKRSRRITEQTADRWCVVLGVHPIELWPEEWPLEMAE